MDLLLIAKDCSDSDLLDKLGERTYKNLYMVNLHPHLSRNGELVFSTNTDAKDFWR